VHLLAAGLTEGCIALLAVQGAHLITAHTDTLRVQDLCSAWGDLRFVHIGMLHAMRAALTDSSQKWHRNSLKEIVPSPSATGSGSE